MKKYEIMYILKPTLDDAARKEEMNKLSSILSNNSNVLRFLITVDHE